MTAKAMSEHEGPVVFEIPKRSCGLCKHFKSSLRVSGRNPKYDYFCKHQGALDEYPQAIALLHPGQDGRHIGTSHETPEWCPVTIQSPRTP